MDSSLGPVVCGAGALLLRVGLALYTTGSVRSKNSAGAVARGVFDLSLAVLAFWAVGAWIAGVPRGGGTFFFVLCVVTIPSGIVVGAAGERSRFGPMAAVPLLLAGIVVPLLYRLGAAWLRGWGFHDVAGASLLHLSGALGALAAAALVGPRLGKYNRDGSSNAIPGHSMPLASAGVLIMLVGWLPYVMGFAAGASALLAANTLLAAAAGTVVALVVSHLKYMKPDIHLTCAGLLGALVAITAAPDVRYGWAAVLIGALAGLIVPLATVWLDLFWKIDDPTAGVGIHGFGAIWGILAAGLFAPTGPLLERLRLVGVQILGLLVVILIALGLCLGLLLVLRSWTGLRSKEADEFDGLDLAEHDIGAYPDFQQTMIKSYHLREA